MRHACKGGLVKRLQCVLPVSGGLGEPSLVKRSISEPSRAVKGGMKTSLQLIL